MAWAPGTDSASIIGSVSVDSKRKKKGPPPKCIPVSNNGVKTMGKEDQAFDQLSIVSFNIEWAIDPANRKDVFWVKYKSKLGHIKPQRTTKESNEKYLENIANELKLYNADVVVLYEISTCGAVNFINELTGYIFKEMYLFGRKNIIDPKWQASTVTAHLRKRGRTTEKWEALKEDTRKQWAAQQNNAPPQNVAVLYKGGAGLKLASFNKRAVNIAFKMINTNGQIKDYEAVAVHRVFGTDYQLVQNKRGGMEPQRALNGQVPQILFGDLNLKPHEMDRYIPLKLNPLIAPEKFDFVSQRIWQSTQKGDSNYYGVDHCIARQSFTDLFDFIVKFYDVKADRMKSQHQSKNKKIQVSDHRLMWINIRPKPKEDQLLGPQVINNYHDEYFDEGHSIYDILLYMTAICAIIGIICGICCLLGFLFGYIFAKKENNDRKAKPDDVSHSV